MTVRIAIVLAVLVAFPFNVFAKKTAPTKATSTATPTPLVIPTLPPYPSPMDPGMAREQPGSPANIALQNRLRVLIQSHPLTRVRVDMDKAIQVGDVHYELHAQPGQIASFAEVPIELLIESSRPFPPGTTSFPAFAFDPHELAKLGSRESIIAAWLILDHEWEHYLQWQNASPSDRLFFRLEVRRERSADACQKQWERELAAYRHECQTAMAWGEPNAVLPGLCELVKDEVVFRKFLVQLMSTGTPGIISPECIPVWNGAVRSIP